LYDIELAVSGNQLVLSWRPHFKGPAAELPGNSAVLAQGVVGLRIDYYLPELGWQSDFPKAGKPGLVRIRAQFADGREWSPLLVAPMIELQPAVRN
jgi:hypothetical protein